jgi:hypothetical protein
MTLTLQLTPDVETKLRERAAAAGKDPVGFALDALQEKLGFIDGSSSNEASPEEWVKEWRTWAAAHPKLSFEVDDSRESIYAGRGE